MVIELAEQFVLGLREELKPGDQCDAWFTNNNSLQDLKLLAGLWQKGDWVL